MRRKPFTLKSQIAWLGSDWMNAEHVKASVSKWAEGLDMWPIREIGGVVDGRLDLLLIPTSMCSPVFKALSGHWTERLGLVGVEVKVERSDFLAGLNSGQFTRYRDTLSGLYIAGPPTVVKVNEVPREHGVIHVAQPSHREPPRTVCRRHPQWQRHPFTEEDAWRIVWAMAKHLRIERKQEREAYSALERKIKTHAGAAIWAALEQIKKLTEAVREKVANA